MALEAWKGNMLPGPLAQDIRQMPEVERVTIVPPDVGLEEMREQFPEHIAVRRPREIRKLLESEGWRVQSLTYSPAPFPVVRRLERALLPIPFLGRLFRYRILVRATPIAARGAG